MPQLQSMQRRLTTVGATREFGEMSWHCLLAPDNRPLRRSRQVLRRTVERATDEGPVVVRADGAGGERGRRRLGPCAFYVKERASTRSVSHTRPRVRTLPTEEETHGSTQHDRTRIQASPG